MTSDRKSRRKPNVGFGDRLEKAMQQRGYGGRGGVKRFATRIPINPNSVSRWKAGYDPDPVYLAKAADVLGVTPEWLLRGEGPMIDGAGESGTAPERIAVGPGNGAAASGRALLADSLSEPHTRFRSPSLPPPHLRTDMDHVLAEARPYIREALASIAKAQAAGSPLDYDDITTYLQKCYDWLDEMHIAGQSEKDKALAQLRDARDTGKTQRHD